MSVPTGVAWLFCPADRPERYARAFAADVVILDLEDGVAAAHKSAAREAIRDSAPGLDLARTVIRINPVDTAEHALDLALLGDLPDVCVMLAKTESAADVLAVPARTVIALCETARGVLNAAAIATAENRLSRHRCGSVW